MLKGDKGRVLLKWKAAGVGGCRCASRIGVG